MCRRTAGYRYFDDPCCVDDRGQLYKGTFKLLVVRKDTNEKAFELCSHEHIKVGKDKVKEAAVNEVNGRMWLGITNSYSTFIQCTLTCILWCVYN